ncbi:MAG: hypothetical protein V1676_03810 [Candidatus Diapherotrites archaeon]
MGRKPISRAEHERRLALYHAGKSDVQIGKLLGKKPNTIVHWRYGNKLIANFTNFRGERAGLRRMAVLIEHTKRANRIYARKRKARKQKRA